MTPPERDRLRALAEQVTRTVAEAYRQAELPADQFNARAYNSADYAARVAEKALAEAITPAVVLSLLDALDASERRLQEQDQG